MMRLSITSEISTLIAAGIPVAIGVSGGKDSQASALAVCEHLDRAGHVGPRLLIHSDLGSVEWRDSYPVCRDLADHLGLELIVVRRERGGLMERWESRWQSSIARYQDLATVTLVPCWSTPAMRFCTSYGDTSTVNNMLGHLESGAPAVPCGSINRRGVNNSIVEQRLHAAISVFCSRPRADGSTWPARRWSGLQRVGQVRLSIARSASKFSRQPRRDAAEAHFDAVSCVRPFGLSGG